MHAACTRVRACLWLAGVCSPTGASIMGGSELVGLVLTPLLANVVANPSGVCVDCSGRGQAAVGAPAPGGAQRPVSPPPPPAVAPPAVVGERSGLAVLLRDAEHSSSGRRYQRASSISCRATTFSPRSTQTHPRSSSWGPPAHSRHPSGGAQTRAQRPDQTA